MFCTSCGTANTDGGRYCPSCGNAFELGRAAIAVPSTQSASASSVASKSSEWFGWKEHKSWLLIFVAIIALVAIPHSCQEHAITGSIKENWQFNSGYTDGEWKVEKARRCGPDNDEECNAIWDAVYTIQTKDHGAVTMKWNVWKTANIWAMALKQVCR